MADENTVRMRTVKDLLRGYGGQAIEVFNEFKDKKIDGKYILDTSCKSIEDIV